MGNMDKKTKHDTFVTQPLQRTRLCCSARLTMSIVAFLGFVNLYALRVNLSVAMVCMVNQTYVSSLHANADNSHVITAVNATLGNYQNASYERNDATDALPDRMEVEDLAEDGNACDRITASDNVGNETGTVELLPLKQKSTSWVHELRNHKDDLFKDDAASVPTFQRSLFAELANTNGDGEFLWSKETQGLLLGSFFWGYLTTQLLGGWLAARFGGKRVLGYCMCACSALTLLMPVAARTDWKFLMTLRILAGMCQGVVWPSMQMMWASWAPPLEIGKLAGFCYAGTQIGNVLTFPIAALLCKYGFDRGWPSVFYVLGAYGMVWFVLWMSLVFDSPRAHPRISPEERHYIETSLKGRTAAGNASRKEKIPWGKILRSKAVWAIVVTHSCANWGTYTFLTNIPTYMREVLKFDIKKNGLLSSLPYIGFWLAIVVSGQVFDFLQSKRWLSTTSARKISNSLGELVPALFVVGVGFMDCTNPVGAVVLLTVGVSMCGCQYGSGFVINSGDIAPRYAGIVFGISNTFATIPGFLAPIAIGIITKEQTQAQWRTVFFICAAIYLFGTIVYIAFGSGQVQPWARQEDAFFEIPTPLVTSQSKNDVKLTESGGKPTKPEDAVLLSSSGH